MGLLFLDTYVVQFSKITGVPYVQLDFIACMAAVYPFCYIFRFIKNIQLRLIFSLIFGIFLQFQLIGLELYHLVIETFITYFFIRFLGRKVTPFVLFGINIAHLTYLHLHNYFYAYSQWILGAETVYMMSICKFSSIAFNYEDGGKEDKDIINDFFREKYKINNLNIFRKLIERPRLLEIFAYNFFFPTALIGPSVEFHDFKKFIRFDAEYKNIDYSKCNRETLREFLKSTILGVLAGAFGGPFAQGYVATDSFFQQNIFYRIFYVFFSVMLIRMKYYTGWSMAQTALDFTGFNYNVKKIEKSPGNVEEVITFDKVDNCNVQTIELCVSPGVKIQYWNRSVHLWLKNYIFLRILKSGIKLSIGVVSLITFIISAFWHGVYPNFYLFFINMFLIDANCKYLQGWGIFDYIETKANFFVKSLCWFFFFWMQDYVGICFCIVSIHGNHNFYKSFYYIPNLILLFGYFYVSFIGKKPPRKGKTETKEE